MQQLAEGKSLADLAKIGWRTNEDGVRKIASQILEILLYLHELKPPVVHRDIKPQNLIWGKDGKIFLVDFGAVQHTYRSTLAKGSTIVGTYGYMAPEQFRGQAVPATDLYGLGATVLFLMTHRSPSDLPQERLKISFRSRIQVSSGFADWLEKMLEPDVEDRFSSAKDALAALQGRMVVAKPRRSVSWKVLAGVGIAGVAAFFVLKSYKWAVLGVIGVQPSGICVAASSGNFDVVRDYLKHGGDPDAKDEGEVPIMPCLLKMEHATKDIAELLIAKVSDVNAKDNEGKTPLHLARSKEMVELLIAKVSDVNAKDNEGKTPLHLARSKEIAELLIAKGADVNAKDNQGNTPLDKAFQVILIGWFPVESQRQNQIDLAKLLISKGAYAAKVNAKDNMGETLLHHVATTNGRKELAKLLIAKGVQVNAKNQFGYTPLHRAAHHDSDLAELLITKGADVNAKNNEGDTPLHVARSQKMAELLIAKGADVNAKDNQGATPLFGAGSEVAELLIAKGAAVNAKDNQGKTPLHMAQGKDLVALLIAKGADVNAKDNQGKTPLQVVISDECTCDRDTVKLLITKGASVNVKNAKGFSPLHLAAGYDWKDIAELIIAKGGQSDAKDNEGAIPLHWSVAAGWQDMTILLIAKGADVNAKDNEGRSPLQWAAWFGQRDVAALLIAKGAKVNARDNEDKTPLSWALKKGDKDTIEFLKSHGGTE